MTAAETEWQPGDPNPFVPDNGLNGGISTIYMSEPERTRTLEADTGTPPPWWRPPAVSTTSGGWTRHCKTCDVQWRGPTPCWMCGGEQLP